MEIFNPVETLMACLAADRRPLDRSRFFHEQLDRRWIFFATMGLIAKSLGYGTDHPADPDARGPHAADHLGYYAFYCVSLATWATELPKSDGMALYKKFRSQDGAGKDACDARGREMDKLLRCARCRIGRFCSAECQKAAWVEGQHKSACLAIAFPHPGDSGHT